MTAIENLTQAVQDLATVISNLNVPANNDVEIQAAADNINASIVVLKAKTA